MEAKEDECVEATLFRRYVADSLFLSPQNKRLTISYSDFLDRISGYKNAKVRKEESADEIVMRLVEKHGLTFKGEEDT